MLTLRGAADVIWGKNGAYTRERLVGGGGGGGLKACIDIEKNDKREKGGQER